MCSRYYRTFEQQAICEALLARVSDEPFAYIPAYNIAPKTRQPVLRHDPDTLQRQLLPMHWGLIGLGSRGAEPNRCAFNARAEGLENSPLWKRPLHRQRCIVPMNGYYEWRKSNRQAFRFSLDGEPMGVAGLWDAWKSADDFWLHSFTIITTDSNTITEHVHRRMPAILQANDYDEWLNREDIQRPPVHLLKPLTSMRLKIDRANPRVANVRNDGPELLNSDSA